MTVENLNNHPPITPESVLASVREMLAESSAKFDRDLAASSAKLDRDLAESSAKFGRDLAESSAKFDRDLAESRADFDRRMKELDKRIGGVANNNGFFAEEYFFNAFENGQTNFFGETFEDITQKLKPKLKKLEDEYDVVLYNHTSVAIIEVKYKAHENDIPDVLKKVETFRILCPYYKDFKIYLGLASMAFYSELEQACKDNGIAIIKQVGNKIVIHDEHLKVF
jgi:hypothetical protein